MNEKLEYNFSTSVRPLEQWMMYAGLALNKKRKKLQIKSCNGNKRHFLILQTFSLTKLDPPCGDTGIGNGVNSVELFHKVKDNTERSLGSNTFERVTVRSRGLVKASNAPKSAPVLKQLSIRDDLNPLVTMGNRDKKLDSCLLEKVNKVTECRKAMRTRYAKKLVRPELSNLAA